MHLLCRDDCPSDGNYADEDFLPNMPSVDDVVCTVRLSNVYTPGNEGVTDHLLHIDSKMP